MSSTDNLPRPADSPCLKCASAGCTSITIGKGDNRKTFPGCATWQQWFSERWQGYQATAYKIFLSTPSVRRATLCQATAYKMKHLRKARGHGND